MKYLYKDLVKEAKKGSEAATMELIEKLHPLIYSVINRYSYGEEKEDLYQEACIILMEAIRDYEENKGVPFLGFAKSRVYFGIHNLVRKNTFELSLDQPLGENEGYSLLELLVDGSEETLDTMVKEELFDKLRISVESLSDKQRGVVIAHYFQGEKLKDIARVRNVHYKGVLQLKKRALRELKNLLE